MAAIIDAEPEPIAELSPDAPVELVTIVERCLAKDPAHRYASTQDLARDLREVGSSRARARRGSGFALTPAPRRRWRWVGRCVVMLVAISRRCGLPCATGRAAPLAQARALLDRFDKQANVDQAIGLLSSIVSDGPKDPAARTMLAEAYWRKFEYSPRTWRSPIGPAKRRASRSR